MTVDTNICPPQEAITQALSTQLCVTLYITLLVGEKLFRVIYYTPGRGKIVPRNVIITLLVGEKLCRVM